LPSLRRILKWSLFSTLGLAALIGGTVLTIELLDPVMRHILYDIKYGYSEPLESRIRQWDEVFALRAETRSAETMADYTNAIGYTYVDEYGHDDTDCNRMFLARWCFERTADYAALTPPSEKRSNQLAFASSFLKQVNEAIKEKNFERRKH
jgi:hypothetical protein